MKRRITPLTFAYCNDGHWFQYRKAITERQTRRWCSEHAPTEGVDAA